MELDELEALRNRAEKSLREAPLVEFHAFTRDGRTLHLMLTDRFQRIARRARKWKSRALLAAFKNAAYGFDPTRPRSRGGRDGIFLIDRAHRPPNAMMRKIFDGFLDKPASGADDLAKRLGTTSNPYRPSGWCATTCACWACCGERNARIGSSSSILMPRKRDRRRQTPARWRQAR